MRAKLAIAALLCLALFSTAASATSGEVGVKYEWQDQTGALSIVAPLGSYYSATDSLGGVVATGIVDRPMVNRPCPNSGPSPEGIILTVEVNGLVFMIGDPEWQWD